MTATTPTAGRRLTSAGHVGRLAVLAAGAVLLLLLMAGTTAAATGGVHTHGSVAAGPPSRAGAPAITAPDPKQVIYLAQQTPWVKAGGRFVLDLGVHSPEPRSTLALSIKLYDRLTSRSELNSSLVNGPTGMPLETVPLMPLAQLVQGANGAVSLSMSVTTGAPSAGAVSPAGPLATPLELLCNSGPCSGVYPVDISLVNTAQGATLGTVGTYLIYDRMAPASIPLRVSLIAPVVAPMTIAASGQPHISDGALEKISTFVAGLSQYENVPFGLAVSPPVAEALQQSSDVRAHKILGELRSLAASELVHPIVDPSYAPVDVASMVSAGLVDQLAAQLGVGASVLEGSLKLRSAPTSSVWASRTNLDPAAAAALRSLGISHLVLPAGNLAPTSSRLSTTQPFYLDTTGTTPDLATIFDQQLTSLTSKGTGQPLGAYHVLAELAQIYFEQPNFPYLRAVVIDPPSSWSPSPAFLHALLGAVASSPFVKPITLATLFSSVPVGAGGAPKVRAFTTSVHPSQRQLSTSVTHALAGAATTLTAFESALPTGSSAASSMAAHLESLLLIAEGRHVSLAERRRLLGFMLKGITGQVDQVRLTSAQITLTARTGRVPITVTSSLPYTIAGRLSLQTDKLIILSGPTQPVAISRHNTVFYFNVQARTAGDFPVTVALTSPEGGLTLLRGRLTVRSTAFSNLAIALSAAAVALLLAWWLRSSWRGRQHPRRAGTHAAMPTQPGS